MLRRYLERRGWDYLYRGHRSMYSRKASTALRQSFHWPWISIEGDLAGSVFFLNAFGWFWCFARKGRR